MFGDLLDPVHLILLLVVALLVFGPKRLPEVGKGLGETLREFRKAMRMEPETPPNPGVNFESKADDIRPAMTLGANEPVQPTDVRPEP